MATCHTKKMPNVHLVKIIDYVTLSQAVRLLQVAQPPVNPIYTDLDYKNFEHIRAIMIHILVS